MAGLQRDVDANSSLSFDSTIPQGFQKVHVPVVPVAERQLLWVQHLQSGSFGEVHEVRDSASEERYVKKLINWAAACNLLQEKASTLKPDNEIYILRGLTHPRIIKLLGDWVSPHRVCLLMEKCQEDLFRRLYRDGAMNRVNARAYMFQLLEALAYLQLQEIAHRDVKLENLLVAASSVGSPDLKLCDFGLARRCQRSLGCATFIGSADYLAPEVRKSPEYRNYGFICDSWSCGVVAYALLTALSPYKDDENTLARSQGLFEHDERVVVGGEPTPASFIQSCMSVVPDERKDPVALADMLWR